jgi:lipoprotein-anchoring transpeptidase ErfK/SrfK
MRHTFRCSSRAGAVRRSWTTPHRLGSTLLGLVGVCAAMATTSTAASAAVSAAPRHIHISPTQQLAVLDYEHRAYRSPRTNAPLAASVPAHRPITGEQTTLPVLGSSVNRHGQHWLKVRLPGRPNSSTGWIKRAGTQRDSTSWNIQIDTAARRVSIYHHGKLATSFSAVVGKPSTPTPKGDFFVEETVIMPTSEPGGPYALATSARSNVLQEFDGGPGQIAIHGRDGLGGTPGQAESHGCIRLMTTNIDWLIARIIPGTPVTIR